MEREKRNSDPIKMSLYHNRACPWYGWGLPAGLEVLSWKVMVPERLDGTLWGTMRHQGAPSTYEYTHNLGFISCNTI